MSSTRKTALYLLVFCTCVYLFTASVEAPFTGDGGEMLLDAVSLATHGFATADQAGQPLLSKFPPGQPFLDLSIAGCFRRSLAADSGTGYVLFSVGVSLLPALIGAFTCVLLFLCCLRLGLSARSALLTALIQGLATMTWPYAQTLFADPTLGCLWLLAFYALLRYRDQAGIGWLVVAGAACGYSVLTKLTAAPVGGLR